MNDNMDTLTKSSETITRSDFKTLSERVVSRFSTNQSQSIVALTKVWQCCKCKETMYRGETRCTWNRCDHQRCSHCKNQE